MAMPSGNIDMLCQEIQQNSSILEEISAMLEQATTSGNMLYQTIRQNPSILEEINEMLEQAATSGNISMLFRAIQQNPSILEEIKAMLEQAATSENIKRRIQQAIQQNSSILEEVRAMVDQAATSGNINMLYRAIQQNLSLLEQANAMLEQALTSGNINMLYRGIPQNPIILQVMLVQAAASGNINMLYQTIQQNPSILEEVDAIPLVNTPLHVAASAGQIEFAIEIMGLKPTFGLKLNSKGLSPIHVALLKNRHNLVYHLVKINKNLVRVEGKERLTPLHLLCQSDSIENIRLLIGFLRICPDSIKDVNARRETALHIALRCGNLWALQIMVDWLKENTFNGAQDLEFSILNWTTLDGNNILHLAALSGDTQAVKLLIRGKKIHKNNKNSQNQTALDLANCYPEIERILEGAGAKRGAAEIHHGGRPNLLKKVQNVFRMMRRPVLLGRIKSSISSQQREAYLVVAALVITTVYQIVYNPPGGFYQPDNNLNSTTSSFSLNSTNTSTVPVRLGSLQMETQAFYFN